MQNEQGRTVFRVSDSIAERFKPLFNEIDNNKDKYGIADYSIRRSTLEEVFIKIGEEEVVLDEQQFTDKDITLYAPQASPPRSRSSFCRLMKTQILMNL